MALPGQCHPFPDDASLSCYKLSVCYTSPLEHLLNHHLYNFLASPVRMQAP